MEGLVMKSTGSWYDVLIPQGETIKSRVRGKFKIEGLKSTNPIAVGDKVILDIESTGTGIINDILERENYIIRKSVHKTGHSHILAANIDQSLLLATMVFPRTSTGFIDRFTVSCETFRIPAFIAFNKLDLLNEEERDIQKQVIRIYQDIGYTCFEISVKTGEGMENFLSFLEGKKTLFTGHSGVGKSTLINSLIPEVNQKTAEVSTFANKGKHTTTFAEMFRLNETTFIIDTPGIKELGLIDIGREELSHYFPEMRELLNECKYHNCTHVHEPGCAVIGSVRKGRISKNRYNNYLGMIDDEDNRR